MQHLVNYVFVLFKKKRKVYAIESSSVNFVQFSVNVIRRFDRNLKQDVLAIFSYVLRFFLLIHLLFHLFS